MVSRYSYFDCICMKIIDNTIFMLFCSLKDGSKYWDQKKWLRKECNVAEMRKMRWMCAVTNVCRKTVAKLVPCSNPDRVWYAICVKVLFYRITLTTLFSMFILQFITIINVDGNQEIESAVAKCFMTGK